MSIVAGSVAITVNADGSADIVGTGLAYALASAIVPLKTPPGYVPLPYVGQETAPFSPAAPCSAQMIANRVTQLTALYLGIQNEANAYSVIATYITANGVVTVPATGIDDSGGHPCTGAATGTIS